MSGLYDQSVTLKVSELYLDFRRKLPRDMARSNRAASRSIGRVSALAGIVIPAQDHLDIYGIVWIGLTLTIGPILDGSHRDIQ